MRRLLGPWPGRGSRRSFAGAGACLTVAMVAFGAATALGQDASAKAKAAEETKAPEQAPAKPAEEAPTPPEEAPKPAYDPFTAPTLTGDWFGLGDDMRDAGINLQYFWNSHFMGVMGGGRTTDGGTKHSATYDLFLNLDFDKMGLIPGGSMLVQARQQWGAGVNPWTGATQQINDDADGNRSIYIDQLYYNQRFLDNKINFQVGYLDYQTIVDRNAYANSEDKQFMNAVFDNNPLIPTASATGLGAALTIQPCEWYSVLVGAGDAQRLPLYKPGFSTTFHDEAWFLFYNEHRFHVKIPTDKGPLPGNYRVGLVYDPSPRRLYTDPRFPVRARRDGNDVGFYLSFDQMLLRENDKDDQGLGGFFRYAYRHRDRYRFNNFWSLGTAYKGLIPERDKDVVGFAVGQLVDSDDYRNYVSAASGDETYYELYYSIQVTPWLAITPDIQYVDNPGGNDSISHAWAGGVRLRVAF
jgi:porin